MQVSSTKKIVPNHQATLRATHNVFSAMAQYFSVWPCIHCPRGNIPPFRTLDAHTGGIYTYSAASGRARLRGEKKTKAILLSSPPPPPHPLFAF